MAVTLGVVSAHATPLLAVRNGRTRRPETSASLPRPWAEPAQGHVGPEVYAIPGTDHVVVERYYGALKSDSIAWVGAALQRGRPFRGYIVALLAKHGLPAELLYLPVIESEYRERAISSSGATGMWQFMANSVAFFNLRIDDMVDERRDFWRAGDAALRKLQDNHSHYRDWLLALAAYNCGRGCLDRIIASSGIRDFWVLRERGLLPAETARYVPKFLSVARVCSYPGRNGLSVVWEPDLEWVRMHVDRSVNLDLLAPMAGVDLALMRRANAELTYSLTPSRTEGYWIKVPAGYAESVRSVLDDPDAELIEFTAHAVRTGETLYGLSRWYGVSVDMILRHNPGVAAESLQIGCRLVIPILGQAQPSQPPPRERFGGPFDGRYVVEPGDTLWDISRRYSITVEDLAAGNDMDVTQSIRVGDVLRVPASSILSAEE